MIYQVIIIGNNKHYGSHFVKGNGGTTAGRCEIDSKAFAIVAKEAAEYGDDIFSCEFRVSNVRNGSKLHKYALENNLIVNN